MIKGKLNRGEIEAGGGKGKTGEPEERTLRGGGEKEKDSGRGIARSVSDWVSRGLGHIKEKRGASHLEPHTLRRLWGKRQRQRKKEQRQHTQARERRTASEHNSKLEEIDEKTRKES